MTKTHHELYRGLTHLLELAWNKQLGIATRIYLADDISTLLWELTNKKESCFEKHKIPEKVMEKDTTTSLAEVISTKDLAATYTRLAVLHYDLREEAMTEIQLPKPGLVDSDDFGKVNFLRIRNDRIKSAYHHALELDADALLPTEPKERAANIYCLLGEEDLRVAISERERARLDSSKKYFTNAASSFLKAAKVMNNSDGNDGILYAKAGYCFFYAGKYEKAISYTICSQEVDPTSGEGFACITLGESYLKLGKPQESLGALLKFKGGVFDGEQILDYVDYHVALGDVQRKLGQTEKAAQHYREAISITAKMQKNERQFEDYVLAIRAEKGLQKLGKAISTTFEQEAIKEGYPKIMEVMKEYD